ncbi:acyltransferase [Mesorhizobium sp. 113-3-9]|uniref:acyltransferase family protein n=1 Tax=Mesorhizobium sp. 113-3-9 TaxID=2744517 RepID=UPI001928E1D9|nr:acyltransferase [Mesorhizobium sp. 113-3-9]BCG89011.1 acyltransferase [Mesorhizobium sp. 113-3-9]
MGSDQDENRRYEVIDALRAIAVMLVLIFHYTSRFPADYIRFDHQMELPWQGVVGVYLFFIISGYCIAMTAERAGTVWMFWLQRFTRLEPALIACIAVTLVVVAALGLPGRDVSALDGLENASWVPLFVPTPLVDGAYWSLLEEAKFYFVFGLIFHLWPDRVLALFTGFTVLGAIAQFSGLWSDHQALIYPFKGIATSYFFFPYSLFFLMGIAARRSTRAVQTVVTAGCLVVVIKLWGGSSFSAWVIALSILGVIGVQLRDIKIWRGVSYIGLISYPLYLLHQNVGVAIIRWLAPWIGSPYVRIGIAFCTVVAIAAFIAWAVEHRFRRRIEIHAARLMSRTATSA